ncbi:hypothetical protein P43SY_011916 [Pythium insidiosum]|uniref:Uncharacterized protein n=1 Tax=Pythium insidiosum TaxID=114742 RepID=A0AAD5L6P1_PYTIN|nr:hypothetical protein P43SY_011916 [Pythium insidiosum]
MKNDVLKHFRFFKTGQPPDIPHDPNFHLMADNGSVVAAMVGVLNISGYGVKIVDRAQLLARDSLRVVTAAQAMYEAIRAHREQRQRELELGMHLPIVPTEENLREMAQQYVGMTREEARRMQDQIYVQASIISNLEKRFEELSETQALQNSRGGSTEQVEGDRPKSETAQAGPTPTTKPGAFKYERKWTTGKDNKDWMLKKPFSSSDYLADIYDDCVAQNRGVAATATTKGQLAEAPSRI